jgi:hypothetical protein
VAANNKLSLYQAKRDFSKTVEPSGQECGRAVGDPPLRHPKTRRNPPSL